MAAERQEQHTVRLDLGGMAVDEQGRSLWFDLQRESPDEGVRAREQRLRVPFLLGRERAALIAHRRAQRPRRLDVVAQLERAHADAAQRARRGRLVVGLPEESARLLIVT